MSTFRDGFSSSGQFNDFDALAAATAGWDLTYSQVGGGAFSGSAAIAATSSVQIAHETWSAPLLVEGAQPPGAVAIALTLSAPGGARWRGKEFDRDRTLIGGTPGHTVHFLSQGPIDIVAVSTSQATFETHLRDRFGIEGATLGHDLSLPLRQDAADCATRGRAIATLLSALMSGAAQSPAARQHLEDAVLQILLDGIEQDALPQPVPLTARRRTARVAEEILRARLDDPPSLFELCQLSGASERTLHAAFQETFGLPPKRYLRVLRLNAARRRLRRAEASVTQVAVDLGFFHFARFAEEYRELFHQLPSETLREARLASGAPAGRVGRAGTAKP